MGRPFFLQKIQLMNYQPNHTQEDAHPSLFIQIFAGLAPLQHFNFSVPSMQCSRAQNANKFVSYEKETNSLMGR